MRAYTVALRRAVEKWRAQPAKARREAIAFFRDEAKQSDSWAKEHDEIPFGEPARHRADARALRAALALLKAAARVQGGQP